MLFRPVRPALLLGLVALSVLTPAAFGLDVATLEPRGYVNDFAGVISAPDAATIESYLSAVQRSTGAQFAVVTIPSLEGDEIEDFGIRLAEKWGVGNQQDEGLIMILAIEDRKQDVEVGYGLEGIITDGYAGRVLRGIRPILRQGSYAGAMYAAVQQFANAIAEDKGVTIEGQPAVTGSGRRNDGGSIAQLITGAIMLLFFLSLLGGGRGGRGGRGGGGLMTAMILGSMLGGGRHRGGGSWGGGGFGGYDGGGGGGFGGFGGGGFGGGGGSSDW